MGKRLPKAELLEEIRVERDALDALLAEIPAKLMTQADVTAGGWSVKDILGHLIGWQRLNIAWYEAEERGEMPAIPAPGLTWKDVPKLNDQIYREHAQRSLKAVLNDYAAWHTRMLALIDEVSPSDLTKVGRYAWAGKTWTLSDYIRANTASHYRWAQKHIRKWLRQQNKKSSVTTKRKKSS